jgi:hypothetical protein
MGALGELTGQLSREACHFSSKGSLRGGDYLEIIERISVD